MSAAKTPDRRGPVPVVVVAGYLGSGKTTLLNHLLRSAGRTGTRLGVLVNDFGKVNIDALLVSAQADGTVSLGNGCMCCTVDADGLANALTSLVRPSAGIDAIVIEASGIAEPKALIRMVTSVADARLRYGGLVYVVDAAHVEEVRGTHPELDSHVAIADLVLVNKVDLIPDESRRVVEELVAQLNATAPRVATRNAAIDPALLFDVVQRDVAQARSGQMAFDELLLDDAGHADHEHLHAEYESVSFSSDRPMDPRRLARFLERPPGAAGFRGCRSRPQRPPVGRRRPPVRRARPPRRDRARSRRVRWPDAALPRIRASRARSRRLRARRTAADASVRRSGRFP